VQLAGINASQQAVIDDRAMKANQFAEQLRDQRNNDAFRQKMMEQQVRDRQTADRNAFFERMGNQQKQALAERAQASQAMAFQRRQAEQDRELARDQMQLQNAQAMRQLSVQDTANLRGIKEQAAQRLSNERLAMNASYLEQLQQDRASASNRRLNLLNFAAGLY
jgi:hypothetical protein